MKKVLGIIISPRKLGNSEILVKEIMNNIPGDSTKELIRLTDLNLKPCKACYKCLQPGTACPVKDDFNFVFNKIKAADALIIGVPVYFLGPHGYYKMLTDRLVGAQNQIEATRGKPCIIVMPYGTKRWEGYSKSASLVLPHLLQMKLIECWQVHATLPGESLLNHANLNYAQLLGRKIFESGQYQQPGVRECSFCGSDLFRLLPGNRLECSICGAQAVLGEDCRPDFSESEYCRFSDQAMEEHFKVWLLEMKQHFLAEKDRLKEVQKRYQSVGDWIKPEI